MPKPNLKILLALAVMIPATAHAAPTPAQRCEADVELASAKFAQCRLTAEARYSKSLDVEKRTGALARCSEKLQQSFAKAVARYGLNCTNVPVAEFDAYLKQCSDDAAAAAAGTALPDYVGDLASCNADLAAVEDDLTTCSGDLMTCSANLAACVALPPGRILVTGLAACWDGTGASIPCGGTGQDGEVQSGLPRAYVDNGDGTITDTNTGLMWEKLADDGSIHDKDASYDRTGAYAKIASLNAGGGFAGHTDWRLPNAFELFSIINLQYFNPAVSPAFNSGCSGGCDVVACSCTYSDDYWSSSSYASSTPYVWLVRFDEGVVHGNSGIGFARVRGVRGGL